MTEKKLPPNKNLPPPSPIVDPLENQELKRLQIIIYLLPDTFNPVNPGNPRQLSMVEFGNRLRFRF